MLFYHPSQQKQAYFSRDSESNLIIIKGRVWNVFLDQGNRSRFAASGMICPGKGTECLFHRMAGSSPWNFIHVFLLFRQIPLCMQKKWEFRKGFCATWLENCQRACYNISEIVIHTDVNQAIHNYDSTIMKLPQWWFYQRWEAIQGIRGRERLWSSSGPLLSMSRCCHFPRQWSPGGFRDWPFHG